MAGTNATNPKAIPTPSTRSAPPPTNPSSHHSPFALSGSAPLAEQSVARDLEQNTDLQDVRRADHDPPSGDAEADNGEPLRRSTSHQPAWGYAMASSYSRPSYIATGGSRSAYLPAVHAKDANYLTEQEQAAMREEERSLLRDNKVIPPKHPHRRRTTASGGTAGTRAASLISALRRRSARAADEEAVDPLPDAPSEQTPLLSDCAPAAVDPDLPYGGQDAPEQIDQKWEEAVAAGMITTTWQREVKVLGRYSRSLILTFLLQYSLTMCSVFAVGHLGKIELGGVCLGSMTANITGYAFFQGLSTSLDTLCAQAYGSGHKKLVGLQTQRMVLFLWVVFIPVAVVWLSAERILGAIVPEKETARLAGQYLKIILIGTPGYAAFEAGKRFVQAQGLFTANLYVLLIVAPLNAFMHWLLVWHLGFGFIGAPISVAITETLMPLTLVAYVRFVAGRECWAGLSRSAFTNWWPMIKLAIPGLIMTLAEYLAFEILTLSASWLSATHLAAQSVLATLCVLTYQIPFPISVAASTRIANLIGATLADAAKITAKVTLWVAVGVGIANMVILSSLRFYIPRLFTSDEDVVAMVASVLPLCAAFQLADALSANCNGILRGIGRQDIGGYVSLFCYYGCALPLSFGLGFGFKLDLYGLWAGPAIGVALVAIIEGVFIMRADWEKAVESARERTSAG